MKKEYTITGPLGAVRCTWHELIDFANQLDCDFFYLNKQNRIDILRAVEVIEDHYFRVSK